MPPHVDLVVLFSSAIQSFNKAQVRENAQQAVEQYSRLISLLRSSGLQAVGKRGDKHGDLLILVNCPNSKLSWLAKRERESNFIHGLPVPNLTSISYDGTKLTQANRIRLVHSFITWTVEDGGLAVVPDSEQWSRVTSILAVHDPEFNKQWIRAWTSRGMGTINLDLIKDHYGEAVGLYFCFLSTYTKSLTFISALGALFYFFGSPHSPLYSLLLLLWSTTFVEYWKIYERKISVRWGTRGAFRVEKRRHDFNPDDAGGVWWKDEMKRLSRTAASIPVIFGFVLVLTAILTGLFVFEAFVTQLYTGPGRQYISLAPTILFIASVNCFLAVYQKYAVRLTNWENHKHQSTYDASLTIKRFVVSAVVAYLGLTLSAFVYVPFGEQVMAYVHLYLGGQSVSGTVQDLKEPNIWEHDAMQVKTKLNSSRLQNQMFAYTVTSQAIGTFLEVGLPFILRALSAIRNGKSKNGGGKGKRVGFESDQGGKSPAIGGGTKEEREFLMRVRKEVALGREYDVFEDYNEMITQFGYVAIWSGVWSLAPVMALINNWMEMRSDALKITVHLRRPIPVRTDSIGPWLECMTNLIWISAVINAALVYLFSPTPAVVVDRSTLLLRAVLVALASSHGFLILRFAVSHLMERACWKGSQEELDSENIEKQVKDVCLKTLNAEAEADSSRPLVEDQDEGIDDFWKYDEGLEEIQKELKDS